jgi:hypothetical protein
VLSDRAWVLLMDLLVSLCIVAALYVAWGCGC